MSACRQQICNLGWNAESSFIAVQVPDEAPKTGTYDVKFGTRTVKIDAGEIQAFGIDGQHRARILLDKKFREELAKSSGCHADSLLSVRVKLLHPKTPLYALTVISTERNQSNAINVETSFWDLLKEFKAAVSAYHGFEPDHEPTLQQFQTASIDDVWRLMRHKQMAGGDKASGKSGQVAHMRATMQVASPEYLQLVADDTIKFRKDDRVFNLKVFYPSKLTSVYSTWPSKEPPISAEAVRLIVSKHVLKVRYFSPRTAQSP